MQMICCYVIYNIHCGVQNWPRTLFSYKYKWMGSGSLLPLAGRESRPSEINVKSDSLVTVCLVVTVSLPGPGLVPG